ncbi:hypothetical protein Ssed_3625 [Shewanella sediminis HAW-EB3]|uniref:Uncharacterized protein n=1 Tax=Shewanella sediminis (strain HAW-EB3) TaxID=425104 RepID=A8FZF6_SHESH|nr:hypothetical protein [Shewanella sediminis]ABV38229.1 hypothetical protein Ssed_3625 [Shewanella sediminis HAW-EB3]
MSIKALKAVVHFNENQRIAPRFILTYLLIWFIWHNQLFTSFFTTSGDLLTRADAALASVADNHYLIVLAITCFFYMARLGYYFLKNKTHALLEEDDIAELKVGSDQRFAKNEDIERLLSMVTDLKTQLAATKEREQKANADKNLVIKKFLALRTELDEVKAENALLTKSNKVLKARLAENCDMGSGVLEPS